MIEGVNSSLSSTQLVRENVERLSNARSFAQNPDRVQEVSQTQVSDTSAQFVVDSNYNARVVQVVDESTGDVLSQFPTQSTLERRQIAEQVSADVFESPVLVAQSTENRVEDAPVVANPEAQLASQALAAGQRAGIEVLSAGVSFSA